MQQRRKAPSDISGPIDHIAQEIPVKVRYTRGLFTVGGLALLSKPFHGSSICDSDAFYITFISRFPISVYRVNSRALCDVVTLTAAKFHGRC